MVHDFSQGEPDAEVLTVRSGHVVVSGTSAEEIFRHLHAAYTARGEITSSFEAFAEDYRRLMQDTFGSRIDTMATSEDFSRLLGACLKTGMLDPVEVDPNAAPAGFTP